MVWEILSKEQVTSILKAYYARHGCDWDAHDFEFIVENGEFVGANRIKKED